MAKIGNLDLGAFPLLLAPMEDVSDPPFRAVCKDNGADLMYTEFISTEGLIRHATKSVQKLDIFPEERPMGIQIFGGAEEAMWGSVDMVCEAKPELLDINYGCPVKAVVCKDAGSALLRNVDKMVKLTEGIVKRSTVPVTVKTRLGWDESTKNIEEVVERLQDIGVAAVSIHGRTRVQMYKGEADWTLIGKIKNNPRIQIPIFGNGDIDSPEKAKLYKERYQVDGIMIGRASIGYPWIFREVKHYLETGEKLAPPTTAERVEACRKHFQKSMEWKNEKLGILEMRRHYANYFKGYPDFKPVRMALVSSMDKNEILEILGQIESTFSTFSLELAP
jgi:nifR3 family TIM-barrel protein